VSAWNLETFEAPPVAAEQDVGVRKPTLAERAAAEMRARQKPASQPVHHAEQATGAAKGPAPSTAKSAKAARPRPVVGGVPGQEEPPQAAQAANPGSAAAGPSPEQVAALVQEARQSGYQDGYRNGLAALESYKQTQTAQMAAFMSDQVGTVVRELHHRLEALEQQLAGRVARVALELARQVVRAEIQQNPEHVLEVAEQALSALLSSARQIVLRLHPEDLHLVQAQLTEVLSARGVRLLPDVGLTRGGCVVESDIATVDATVEARWDRSAASLGQRLAWHGGRESTETTLPSLPEEQDELDEWMGEAHAEGHAPREEGQ
jgi:flagellar assembly protein FliH